MGQEARNTQHATRSTQHVVFGIRHHGPGSARSLRRALAELQPDAILVEGPPDADAVLPLVVDEGMEPPVALLVYDPRPPPADVSGAPARRATFFPLAVFSPEWQALHYGLTHGIPVRFMDLPVAHRFAIEGLGAGGEGAEVGGEGPGDEE